ncbi:hypothetical protein GPECTOR_238g561 [Gonium pectorale]|uniref:P/Homo B domain-containing protein n=1 Tax=Gonium pectorale TaxID=33097 RepID=A0A150FWF0_GONPE|nr:hypothetical protein GPECTOR_238g561 [Gonium pectorale]|eukprot:KXZ41943.1 hypothetical protein GPECTOR_238g561 [Gonium pectorale]
MAQRSCRPTAMLLVFALVLTLGISSAASDGRLLRASASIASASVASASFASTAVASASVASASFASTAVASAAVASAALTPAALSSATFAPAYTAAHPHPSNVTLSTSVAAVPTPAAALTAAPQPAAAAISATATTRLFIAAANRNPACTFRGDMGEDGLELGLWDGEELVDYEDAASTTISVRGTHPAPSSGNPACTFRGDMGEDGLELGLWDGEELVDYEDAANTTISVQGCTGTLSRVTLSLNVSHSYAADLVVRLTSPAGQTAAVLDGTAPEEAALLKTQTYTFTDSAPRKMNTNTKLNTDEDGKDFVPGGSFKPEEAFKAFGTGSPAGRWTLTVQDLALYSAGTLLYGWTLTVQLA